MRHAASEGAHPRGKRTAPATRLPPTPNTKPLQPADDEVAFDVTSKLLGSSSASAVAPLLRKGSLADFLATAGGEKIHAFFVACGEILPAAATPLPADKAVMHGLSYDASKASYELQVRGVLTTAPTFVLRIPKGDVPLLAAGWAAKPAATVLPACLLE